MHRAARSRTSLLAVVIAVTAGCGGAPVASPQSSIPDPTHPPTPSPVVTGVPQIPVAGPIAGADDLRTEVDVPITQSVSCGDLECVVPTDILSPIDGADLPTFVLVPGGPLAFHQRRYMELLAIGLAREGGVVFLTSYRSEATRESPAESGMDIRCSIRFARAETARFGGNPANLVLVGHSLGSEIGIAIAAAPEVETPYCLAEGDLVPSAVVGLDGFPPLPLAAATTPPMWFGVSEFDVYLQPAEALAALLRDADLRVELKVFSAATHEDLVDPATDGLVDFIFEAARS